MSQNPRNKLSLPPPIVSILIGLGILWMWQQGTKKSNELSAHISLGDRILISSETTATKQAGVKAFAKKKYPEAIEHFQASLMNNRNDPETVIYLNNARVANSKALKIAVSVPVGTNPNVAQEILRGVAQAQLEFNQKRGIDRIKLQVEIANDDNNPELVKKIAQKWAADRKILAVIGHNASVASIAAAPIYQKAGLVMVTPTSSTNQLSGFGHFIFRATLNVRSMVIPLANYAVKTAGKTKITACVDHLANDSFKDEFITSLSAVGGQYIEIDCELSSATFNAETAIAEAVSKGAEGVMLIPHIDRLERVISLAHANRGKLALYGSSTMYTIQTLENGQNDLNGLVLPAPWHPQAYPDNSFSEKARQLWGGRVNWRTANSYDAAQAIMAGLHQNPTREGLPQTLRNPGFMAPGSGEKVRFLPTGDRDGTPILVRVQVKGTGDYAFVPIAANPVQNNP
jgi:branched-chain amino acid transport system substrate-binding protein